MHLRTSGGSHAFNLIFTPGGWSLVCFGRDPFYDVTDGFRFADLLARRLRKEGREHFKPVFEIDYVGANLINITAFHHTDSEEARLEILSHLADLESEFDLGVLPLVQETLCNLNFLNGINGSLFLRKGLTSLESTHAS